MDTNMDFDRINYTDGGTKISKTIKPLFLKMEKRSTGPVDYNNYSKYHCLEKPRWYSCPRHKYDSNENVGNILQNNRDNEIEHFIILSL